MSGWDAAESRSLIADANARRDRLRAIDAALSAPDHLIYALADQLEAAGVEIERLLDAEHKANGIAMKERESADRFAKLWHDDVKAAETDRDRKLDAISDALHRAGVGDAPRLVDRIALAGEELHKLRRAAQERDGLQAERDSLRQQLEAAQRRIADLETLVVAGEEDIAHLTKVRRETHMLLTDNKVDGLEVRASARARMADLAAAQQQLEAKTSELAFADRSLTSTMQQLEAWKDKYRVDTNTYEESMDDLRRPLAAARTALNASPEETLQQAAARVAQSAETRLADLAAEHRELEAARLTIADLQRQVADRTADAKVWEAEARAAGRNLDAAKKQIADLEVDRDFVVAAGDASNAGWRGTLAELATTKATLGRAIAAQASMARYVEGIGKGQGRADLTAVLRIIATVYQSADIKALPTVAAYLDCHLPGYSPYVHRIVDALTTARAALTPELLAVIATATSEPT